MPDPAPHAPHPPPDEGDRDRADQADRPGEAAPAGELSLALELADIADEITMSRFLAVDLTVETKPDHTPVTDADRAVEQAIRQLISARRPADAVLGEEYGSTGSGARRWVIDPVDGTKNFLRGVPVWATLIALMQADRVEVGVVSAPALGRRWWAARGSGAWGRAFGAPTRRLRVSAVAELADASVSYSSLDGWAERGRLDRLLELTRQVWRNRAYGDFYSHVLVAEGAVDASFEPSVSLWDLAAISLLVEEAGGRFTGLDGVAGPASGSAVASNGWLHETVLQHLSE